MPVAERRRRRWPALLVAAVAFAAVPALLVAVSRWRLHAASPLHGARPPWSWTREGLRSWWRSLGRGLETTDQLVDLFVRVATTVAWICVAVLAVVVVSEVLHQRRDGLPSGERHRLLGLGTLGRWIAAGLVSVLPVAASPVAAAGRPAPTAAVVQPRLGPVVQRTVDPPADPGATGPATHRVRRGESLWSIAELYARRDQVDELAAQITALNLGRTMNDGHRFVTAALVEPGWDLLLPAGIRPPSSVAATAPGDQLPAAAAPPSSPSPSLSPAPPSRSPAPAETSGESHLVVPGDSYWRIAEQHLDQQAGHEVSEREIFDYVPELIERNAPRLDHHDPRMLFPGERVAFGDPPATPATPVLTPVPAPPPAHVWPDGERPGLAHAADEPPPTHPTASVEPPATLPAPSVPVVRGTAAPTPTTTSSPDTLVPFVAPDGAGQAPSMLPIGLGGAGLVAGGALALITSRRRARLRQAQVGQRLLETVPERVRQGEQELRAAAPPSEAERIARLDLALRAAAGDLADQQSQVIAAVVGGHGEIALWLDVVATPIARSWRSDAAHKSWVLPAEVPLTTVADDARRSAQPCPALAHLGRTDGGDLYVDVEAIGVLAVEGSTSVFGPAVDDSAVAADELVRAIAASLALSPLAEPVRVVTVGLGEIGALGVPEREEAPSLADALQLAADHARHLAPLSMNATTFRLRARRAAIGSSEPLVVAARLDVAGEEPALDELRALSRPGCGVATVVNRLVDGVTFVVRQVGEGRCRLDPLGVEFVPVRLAAGDVQLLAEVIDGSEPVLTNPPVEVPVVVAAARIEPAGADAGSPEETPPWTFLVRLLGPVAVERADGAPVEFDRSKALELVVWLAQHRGRARRGQARAALWDVDVRDATFANVVSEARRALGRLAPLADGQEWIGRSAADQLPLHPGIVTDADVLATAVGDAATMPPAQAAATLRNALAQVRGMPFAGTSYLWPDGEGITSALVLLVTGAAVQLANLALEVDDIDGVFWATQQGLLALPGHEELVALRMRAHGQRGDRAGVRQEWESYERALRADAWGAGEPSPKLVSLRGELVGGRPAAPAVP